LWHGANWTFVIWGALHGFYLIFSTITKGIRNKFVTFLRLTAVPDIYRYIKVIITFSLVCFAWIFFRASCISDAVYIITNLFSGWSYLFNPEQFGLIFSFDQPFTYVVGIYAILVMECVHLLQRQGSVRKWIAEKPIFFRWLLYYSLVASILFLGNLGQKQFIYFQF